MSYTVCRAGSGSQQLAHRHEGMVSQPLNQVRPWRFIRPSPVQAFQNVSESGIKYGLIRVYLVFTITHIALLFGCFGKKCSWFTWCLNHRPGPSIYSKKETYDYQAFPTSRALQAVEAALGAQHEKMEGVPQ